CFAETASLHHTLKSLHDPGEAFAPPLHFSELTLLNLTGTQGFREDVRCLDGVGDRAIDAHTTDRQHHMRSIADDQETRSVPLPQAIGLDGEDVDVLQILNRVDAVGEPGDEVADRALERRRAIALERLIAPLGDDVSELPFIHPAEQRNHTPATDIDASRVDRIARL